MYSVENQTSVIDLYLSIIARIRVTQNIDLECRLAAIALIKREYYTRVILINILYVLYKPIISE